MRVGSRAKPWRSFRYRAAADHAEREVDEPQLEFFDGHVSPGTKPLAAIDAHLQDRGGRDGERIASTGT